MTDDDSGPAPCDVPLFDVDREYPFPPPSRMPRPIGAPRFTRYRPVRRVLCDVCITEIHRLGIAEAPLPMSVRWRGVDEWGRVALLCDRHKAEREERQ